MTAFPTFAQKVALVTGGAKRLGRAMAEAIAADGWRVVLHYRGSQTEAEDVVDGICRAGGQAVAMQADLSVEAEMSELGRRAAEPFGPPDLLINNASIFEQDDAFTADRADWDRHVETNLRAPFVLSQAFVRHQPQGDALIVNMLDQRVWKLTPQFMTYTLSKSALWTLTQTLAQAFGPLGVRVNGIGPGPTMRNARQSEDDFAAQGQATILGRGAATKDVLGALRFLIESPSVTGQMIAVDAGQHLAWRTPDVSGPE